ncbi:MAG TPA: hypothetical protein VK964_03965 [Nocardioidaceae bacterium]|nr:hypothetical protein [Nocardioidaceae bacterium]
MTWTNRLSDRTLRRAAWVATAFLPAAVVGSLPVVARVSTVDPSWNGGLVGEVAFLLVLLSFPLAGLLVLRRQPRNRVAWLLEGVGLIWGLGVVTDVYSAYGLVVAPGTLPGAGIVAGATAGSWALGIGVMGTFLILLFPDGRLPSSRWRPVAWIAGVSMVMVTVIIAFMPGKLAESAVPTMDNPLGAERAEPVLTGLLFVFLPLIPLSILACAASLVLRFRRSSGVERLQLKWLASAGVVVAVLYVIAMATTLATDAPFQNPNRELALVLQTLSILSFVLLPTAIAVAVLRHRLYGIDAVINQALVYVSLTVALAAVYIGSVLLLQLLLSAFASQSDLAVAVSTLTVAALFRPARRRFQSAVDRRFYRSRYDAARTLEDFTARLRHEVDLDAVAEDLSRTVGDTVHPAHVSLWIRP